MNGSTICLFSNIFNIKCIGCGITNGVIEAINGNYSHAINYNFSVVIVLPLLIYLWFQQAYKIFLELIK